jgi:hypothetical protein
MEIINHEHVRELNDRFLERSCQAKPDPLAGLQNHRAGGWNSIFEGEAALFARWFESSRALYDAKAVSSS